jgi:hypothetical protein
MTCKNCLWQQQIPTPLAAPGLTYEKDVFAFISLPFDYVATGLRIIQFLFTTTPFTTFPYVKQQ